MNAFRSIAQMKDTNLAVVAPGIAEALFATALGLMAAIPAVIFYNNFPATRRNSAMLDGVMDEALARLSRRLTGGLIMAGGIAQNHGGRSRRRRRRKGLMAEINVTPFVDVMLVLLIVFMVTAPLLTAGVPFCRAPKPSRCHPKPSR